MTSEWTNDLTIDGPTLDSPLLTPGTSSGYQTPSSSSATSSLPYLLVPNLHPSQALQPAADMSKRPRPSFPLSSPQRLPPPHPMSSIHPLQLPNHYKAPQHRHAHHLHAIPPREKTTRTLILDHMLWLHASARFAQVRAELGMNPDRAGSAEDEDDWITFSDGECADPTDKEKDAVNARAFKARADGLEKVLSAMLDQPPEELPFDSQDLLFRDTSFQAPATLLPNGVRLRISLAGLINDIFAEDTVTVPREELETIPYYASAPPQLSSFTPALSALSRLSSFAHHNEIPVLPPFQAFAATADPSVHAPPAQSILPPPPPAGSIFSSIPRGAGPESPWALGSLAPRQTTSNGPFSIPAIRSSSSSRFPTNVDMPPPPPRVFRAVGRSRDFYNAGIYAPPSRAGSGAGPSSSSSRPRRCPHHLTYSCPPSSLCLNSLKAQSPAKTSKSRTRSSIGAGLSSSGPPLRRAAFDGRNAGKDARMTDMLPKFLRLSALVAVELGSEARGEEESAEEVAKMALGKRKESFAGRGRSGSLLGPNNEPVPSSSGSTGSCDDSDDDATSTGKRGPKLNARPTKLWYQLLAGLLTRSALQGYLVKGWKGTDPVEVLLGVGIGGTAPPLNVEGQAKNVRQGPNVPVEDEDEEDEEEEKEYEPDDMPDLTEAWHILFGFSTNSPTAGSFEVSSREALEEYERIMAERMSDFLAMPSNCPDLAAHLTELSIKYPSQPIDRAVLRFCEAVARWRGKPELENYKSRGSEPPTPTSATPNMSIHSLVHPPPTLRPLIERYFMLPTKADRDVASTSLPSAWDRPLAAGRRDSVSSTGTKRSRRSSWADGKGKKVVIDQAWMEEDEYVGPYGI